MLIEHSAQRVAPTAMGPDGSNQIDYADAFEIRAPAGDERTAEDWMRRGLEGAPPPLRWTILLAHRYVLRFDLAPRSAPGNIMGWRIVTSTPDLAHLQATSPLLRGDLVARREGAGRVTLSTYLSFRRPRPASLVWTLVGPLHRRIAPYLLERSASAGTRPGERDVLGR